MNDELFAELLEMTREHPPYHKIFIPGYGNTTVQLPVFKASKAVMNITQEYTGAYVTISGVHQLMINEEYEDDSTGPRVQRDDDGQPIRAWVIEYARVYSEGMKNPSRRAFLNKWLPFEWEISRKNHRWFAMMGLIKSPFREGLYLYPDHSFGGVSDYPGDPEMLRDKIETHIHIFIHLLGQALEGNRDALIKPRGECVSCRRHAGRNTACRKVQLLSEINNDIYLPGTLANAVHNHPRRMSNRDVLDTLESIWFDTPPALGKDEMLARSTRLLRRYLYMKFGYCT